MRERENWQCMCSGFELRHMNRRKQMIKKRRAAAAATKENGKETRREFVYNCAAAFCNYPKEESKKEDPKELCGPRARYWKPKRRRNKKKKRRKQRRHQRLVWGKVDRPKKNKKQKGRNIERCVGNQSSELLLTNSSDVRPVLIGSCRRRSHALSLFYRRRRRRSICSSETRKSAWIIQ